MLPQGANDCQSAGGPPTCGCHGKSANLAQAECTAWVSIFDKTGGPHWNNCKDSRLDPCGRCAWRADGPVCNNCPNGTLLKCSTDGMHITWMNLYHNNLRGAVPQALSALTRMALLDLSANQITGTVPEVLSVIAGLTYLHMGSNKLTGSIPEKLSALKQLRFLSLTTNALTGSIPEGFVALTKLNNLRLDWNKLTGVVPALPFKNYERCILQGLNSDHPTNQFACPLPKV
jgi:hypothetical protein